MTEHICGQIGREEFDRTQRFVEVRLGPCKSFGIVRVFPRGDGVDVIARLRLQIPACAAPPQMQSVGAHEYPGRIEGNQFVRAHRFVGQREGRAWRMYQFEEVDERLW